MIKTTDLSGLQHKQASKQLGMLKISEIHEGEHQSSTAIASVEWIFSVYCWEYCVNTKQPGKLFRLASKEEDTVYMFCFLLGAWRWGK